MSISETVILLHRYDVLVDKSVNCITNSTSFLVHCVVYHTMPQGCICTAHLYNYWLCLPITLDNFMRTIKARGATLIALAMARVKLAKPYVFLEITANYRTFHAAYTNVFAEL